MKGLQHFCYAKAASRRTGKAKGWQLNRGGPFAGHTAEAALEKRAQWLREYMQHEPVVRGKRNRQAESRAEADDGVELRQSRRSNAPASFAASKAPQGPKAGHAKAGPGRGHTFEPAERSIPTASDELPPPPDQPRCWLQQLSSQKQWQSQVRDVLEQKIGRLEKQLSLKDGLIEHQMITIENLRNRVRRLPACVPESPLRPLKQPMILTAHSTQHTPKLHSRHRYTSSRSSIAGWQRR